MGDVRRVGLLAAVEFSPDHPSIAQSVNAAAEALGVLFRVIDNTIAISTPYVTTPEQIETMVSVLQQSIASAIPT